MGNRWIVSLAAVVAIVAVGGIGFSAFTATAYVNGTAQAGTLNLYWTNAGEPTGYSSWDQCSESLSSPAPSTTLMVTANNLAPGDYCTFTGTLNDGGSLPASVYDQVTSFGGTGCTWFAFDTFGGHGYPESPIGPIVVTSGTPLSYALELGLSGGQGNGCQNANIYITLTFTASDGS